MDIYIKLDKYLTEADNIEKLKSIFENGHHGTQILNILKKTLVVRNSILPGLEKVKKVLSVPGVQMPKKEQEKKDLEESLGDLDEKLASIMNMETRIRIPGAQDNIKNITIGLLLKSIVPAINKPGAAVSETA